MSSWSFELLWKLSCLMTSSYEIFVFIRILDISKICISVTEQYHTIPQHLVFKLELQLCGNALRSYLWFLSDAKFVDPGWGETKFIGSNHLSFELISYDRNMFKILFLRRVCSTGRGRLSDHLRQMQGLEPFYLQFFQHPFSCFCPAWSRLYHVVAAGTIPSHPKTWDFQDFHNHPFVFKHHPWWIP